MGYWLLVTGCGIRSNIMATSTGRTAVVQRTNGFPFIIRVLWFFIFGWHVTLYWIVIAWLLNITVIGMPLGLWMWNRVPLVLLRCARSEPTRCLRRDRTA